MPADGRKCRKRCARRRSDDAAVAPPIASALTKRFAVTALSTPRYMSGLAAIGARPDHDLHILFYGGYLRLPCSSIATGGTGCSGIAIS
jgi:hypothetical protein